MQDWQSAPVVGGQQPAAQPTAQQPRRIMGAPKAEDPTDVRDYNTGRGDEAFNRTTTFRTEFMNRPEVKDFREVQIQAEQIGGLANREGTAMGDLGLVFSFMKTLDPGSTVREGEFATASNAAGIPERMRVAYNKMVSGEGLSVDQRQDMAATAQSLVYARAASYNRTAQIYRGLLEAEGVNPDTQGVSLFEIPQAPAAQNPTAQEQAPLGYEIGFDKMGRDQSFDRSAYLQEQYGIEPGQETRLVGLLNANRGNPNLTMDSLRQIYSDAGVPPPDEAGMADLLEQMRNPTRPFTGIDTSGAKREYEAALDAGLEAEGVDPNSAVDSSVFGAARGVTLGLSDEITGVGNAVAAGLTLGDPVAAYQVNRDLTRRMAERSREESPISAYGSEIVGGLVTGVGTGSNVRTVTQAAKLGALEGGVAGFGYGEGLSGSLANAALGSAIGAPIGAAVQAGGRAVSNALTSRRPQVDPAMASEVSAAGQRMNVTTRQMDIDPVAAGQRAQVQQSPEGRAAIGAAEASDLAEMENALTRNLSVSSTSRTESGEVIQEGIASARGKLRKDAGNLYNLAHREAGEITPAATSALQKIDGEIAELQSQGAKLNKAEVNFLSELREDLSGGLSIKALRAQRTGLRQKLQNQNLYSGDFERRLEGVYDAVSADIRAGLKDNPAALARYNQADDLWKQQAKLGKDVADVLLGKDGKKGAGQAADTVLLWARKDPARMARLLEEVPTDTKAEVRALVTSNLGRSSNGKFSLDQFLTATGGGSGAKVSPAVVRSLFGEDGASAIKDLRTLAQARVGAQKATNRSDTGGIVEKARNSFRRLVLGSTGFGIALDAGGGMGVGTLAAAGTALGGEIFERMGRDRAIRLLLNPDFTGWLKKLPNTAEPQAINKWFDGARQSVSRTPGALADFDAFARGLVEVANDNMATAAVAEEPTE